MSSESSRGDEHHVTFSHKFHFDNAQALSSTEVDLIRSIPGSWKKKTLPQACGEDPQSASISIN